MARCKRCDLKTTVSQEEIDKMVDEVKAMKGIRLVSEDKYKERFQTCMECEYFFYSSTCNVCGCVMQVRARLQEGKCPKKKW